LAKPVKFCQTRRFTQSYRRLQLSFTALKKHLPAKDQLPFVELTPYVSAISQRRQIPKQFGQKGIQMHESAPAATGRRSPETGWILGNWSV